MPDEPVATIASLQVGKVRTEGSSTASDSMNRKWTTAFYKYPVPGPLDVFALGIKGDEIADSRHHGGIDKAVLAYSAEHYPRWRSQLLLEDFLPADKQGVDLFGETSEAFSLADFGPGAFAENLTIEGMSETNVCLGDQYQIGDNANESVLVEVSQPREPCWKISRRWKHKTLTKLVAQTGRTGWYFRVLQEGKVNRNSPITLINRIHDPWTISRANDVLMGRESDRYAVAELMEMEVLSASWKKSLS